MTQSRDQFGIDLDAADAASAHFLRWGYELRYAKRGRSRPWWERKGKVADPEAHLRRTLEMAAKEVGETLAMIERRRPTGVENDDPPVPKPV